MCGFELVLDWLIVDSEFGLASSINLIDSVVVQPIRLFSVVCLIYPLGIGFQFVLD